ncbi:MAG TPA: uroporphyrinogen-III synthase, partial [Gemmatimonadaceae bacterium]
MIVTRAAANAAELVAPLAALGAEVIEAPATRIEPLDRSGIAAVLGNLSIYDWVLFTSRNAVHIAWTALHDMGRGAQLLETCRVAAVGPATAGALVALGIRVDVMPPHFVAESLLETLRARSDVRGTRVLYLAAEGARDVLPQGLRALGATVDVTPLYRSLSNDKGFAPLRERLLNGDV